MKAHLERINIIGGEWIYYKIYCGFEVAEDLLKSFDIIAEEWIKEEIIQIWFFIRYSDPKHHLRIRFKCSDVKYISLILNEIYRVLNPLFFKDLIWDLQIGTYKREIERYGIKTMELSEKLFYYDSVMIVKYLNCYFDENFKWIFSLVAIDYHLNSFCYDLESKYNLLESLSIGFKNEFHSSKALNQGLNEKYRKYRKEIEKIMDKSSDYRQVHEILECKMNDSKGISLQIINLHEKNELEINFNELNASYIHMMMNRIFPSENRKYEMVCYNFLTRYYQTQISLANLKKVHI